MGMCLCQPTHEINSYPRTHKFHQESLGRRLMNGYVPLSAHPSYPITHILPFFCCYFIPESSPIKARKQGNNNEFI